MFAKAGLRPACSGVARGATRRSALGPQWHGMLWSMVVIVMFLAWALMQFDSTVYAQMRRGFSSGKNFWSASGGEGAGPSPDGSASHQFSYKAVVAYQPKDRDDPLYKTLQGKQSPTGEDNFFIRINSPTDYYAGVADGVGGWAEHGYDSSAISRELCKAMSDFSAESKGPPKNIIDLGYDKIKKDGIVQVGGTTAIVAHFPPDGKLQVANLGDSWCGVFRNEKLAFQTKFQTVGFNAPYQLAIIPQKLLVEAQRRGSSYIRNQPADADEYTFQLQKGDIVFLATDGVTDNVATEDMELFLRDRQSLVDSNLQQASNEFVSQTVQLSKDPSFPSVFSQEISKMTGKNYSGGKEDDITLVLVKVE
ncbi:related to protein phosphatase 2C homolog 7, mitochondrial [Zygosaccharomyces bailii]|uniref:Protein phosphatase n=1 Tax=Zygosaccharomyces bailii (strain CLIB 213 / ATCC 58445 / CBS 680 / BCRC 21525 / NBRC 1098 / NCYC 1416 / NRRL Y-2227) TaxID=1333698 RepID=A0A8J2T5Q1_ZYGB2|nr:ZYBA0S03-02146g1_1 [Zygosaccharomyces bailii CLIB 213]CDH15886.1 related to PTC7-2C protein phosphatase [Zygosaccharomyces bailii ISA1307]SJM82785.1 related to protein phosphatase 2C homolog 7, mitochondrial [Zygosaccharomyces bailii]